MERDIAAGMRCRISEVWALVRGLEVSLGRVLEWRGCFAVRWCSKDGRHNGKKTDKGKGGNAG